MKYGVIIKTSDLFQSGTDANVYLGMQGSLGSMREVQISDGKRSTTLSATTPTTRVSRLQT